MAGYSPAGTAHLLGDIATETIYLGIYRGLVGGAATEVLRTRRHRRRRLRSHQPKTASQFLGLFVSIHDRPASIDDRSEFGHYEGDLIIGARNRSALVTLIERVSRTQVVLDLLDGYTAPKVCECLDS